MARFGFLQSAALAVIAAAGALAVPAQAQDASRQEARAAAREARAQVRQERQEQRVEARGGAWQARAEARQQRAEARQQRSAPEGGWRSQGRAEGTRYGRSWDNGGTVARPARAYRGAEAQVPQRAENAQRAWRQQRIERGDGGAQATGRNRDWSQRNGTYSERTRDRGATDRVRTYQRDDWSRADRDGYRNRTRDGYGGGAWNGGSRYSSRDRDGRGWDNNWRRDRRYDWQSYRNSNRRVYSIGRYYSPYSNYRYSRLGIGFFLDSGFYGNRYWINDPWQYRLPEVYGPYRWVRYYDDVLLVDIYTGEVVDVIHDFFW